MTSLRELSVDRDDNNNKKVGDGDNDKTNSRSTLSKMNSSLDERNVLLLVYCVRGHSCVA